SGERGKERRRRCASRFWQWLASGGRQPPVLVFGERGAYAPRSPKTREAPGAEPGFHFSRSRLWCCAEVSAMRLRWLAGTVLLAAGCTPTTQERVRAYNDDGLYLFQRGDFNHARDTFQAGLDLTPDDPNLRFNLAQCYDRSGDQDKAEKIYRECLQKTPDHAESQHALCALLVRQK